MKTLRHSRILLAALPLAGLGLAAIPAAAATAPHAVASHTVHISAKLTVTHTDPPVCTNGVCLVHNHGKGTVSPYGGSPSPPWSPPTPTSRPAEPALSG